MDWDGPHRVVGGLVLGHTARRSFASVARYVAAGLFIRRHAGQHDAIQRGVGLAVSAAVEPLTGGLSGGGRQRSDAAFSRVTRRSDDSDAAVVVIGDDKAPRTYRELISLVRPFDSHLVVDTVRLAGGVTNSSSRAVATRSAPTLILRKA